MALFSLRNVSTTVAGKRIHDGLSMDIQQGESLGLIGASGSGKTLLLRVILGLQTCTQGQILYKTKNLVEMSEEQLSHIHRQWGVVFQTGALFSSLSVLDNVALPLRERDLNLPEATALQLAHSRLNMVGYPRASVHKLPAELSGGMTKRASLARALIHDPEVIFLDEPTAGLDPQSARQFDELMIQLRTFLGLTVVMVTHDLESLAAMSTQVAFLHAKKVSLGALGVLKNSKNNDIQDYFRGVSRLPQAKE